MKKIIFFFFMTALSGNGAAETQEEFVENAKQSLSRLESRLASNLKEALAQLKINTGDDFTAVISARIGCEQGGQFHANQSIGTYRDFLNKLIASSEEEFSESIRSIGRKLDVAKDGESRACTERSYARLEPYMRCFNATQSVRLLLTFESGARITKITWDGIRDQADRYLACSVKRAQLNRGDADMVAKAIRNVASNIQPEMNRFVEAAEIFLSTSDR